MIKSKFMPLALFIVFSMILGVSMVSALYPGNLSINAYFPANLQNLTINVTYDGQRSAEGFASGEVNVSKLYLTIGSSLTANLSVNITGAGGLGNSSINNSIYAQFLIFFNTSFIEDANSYNITAVLTNLSKGSTNVTTSVLVDIDNHIPQAATSLSPADKNVDADGIVTFSGTVTGANTTACTLEFVGISPTGGSGQSMTHSGNSCTLTLSNIADQTYTWFIKASDGKNTTDSSSSQVTSDIQSGGGFNPPSLGAPSEGIIPGVSNTLIIIIIIIIIVVIVVRRQR